MVTTAPENPTPNPITLWHRLVYEIYAALICSISAGATAWCLAPWSGFDVTRWEAASNIFWVALILHFLGWIGLMLMPASWRS